MAGFNDNIDKSRQSITIQLFNNCNIKLTKIGQMVFWNFWTNTLVKPYQVSLGTIPPEFRPRDDQIVPMTEFTKVFIAGCGNLQITTYGNVFMVCQNQDPQSRAASGAYVTN